MNLKFGCIVQDWAWEVEGGVFCTQVIIKALGPLIGIYQVPEM